MSPAGGDATFDRAGAIIRRSKAAALAEGIVNRLLASARGSRAIAAVRRPLEAFQRWPAGERAWCAAAAIAAALAGHVVLAAFEPARARPTTSLTVLLLLAIALAAIAAANQTSEP